MRNTKRARYAGEMALSGLRVLDLTRVAAGPYCTQLLGDLGAQVFKIEAFNGDETRRWGPPFVGPLSCYFLAFNRNKRSICLNLRSQGGVATLKRLTKRCDVLVENSVPGRLEALGLGYRNLSPLAPSLIYCSISGYGPDGPHAHRPGYDVIAAGTGGLLSITGEKNGGPVKVGVAVTDIMTGLHAYGSIMAALLLRNQTGKGQRIDCNLLSTQVSGLINIGSNYLNAGLVTGRYGTEHASIVPYQAFNTKDSHIIIGVGSDDQFRELCRLLDIRHIAEDEKFSTNANRVANRNELIGLLDGLISRKTTDEWMTCFEKAPFPCGPVNSIDKVFADPQVQHLGLVEELPHPHGGTVKVVGPPVKFSDDINKSRLRPPLLGEHTDEVLAELLGYSTAKLKELKTEGAIYQGEKP